MAYDTFSPHDLKWYKPNVKVSIFATQKLARSKCNHPVLDLEFHNESTVEEKKKKGRGAVIRKKMECLIPLEEINVFQQPLCSSLTAKGHSRTFGGRCQQLKGLIITSLMR